MGTGLLCLVYCLPTEPMQAHTQETVAAFVREGDNPFLVEGYKGSSLDNYTDAIMLGNAIFSSEQPAYKAAMLAEAARGAGEDPQTALWQYLETGQAEAIQGYARYWHGYLCVLKPLLLVMNFQKIRFLNGIAEAGLFLAVMGMLYKRNMKKGMAAFLLAVLSLFPITLPWSLQFSSVYYVGMLACLAILCRYEVLEEKDWWVYFFLIVGSCTSFMDFLTYPAFSFGMPLTICIAIRRSDWRDGFVFTIKNGICWSLGYVGMWAGKWTIGSLLTGENIWLDAIGTIGTRASATAYEQNTGRIMAVLRNLYIYFNWFGVLLAIALLLWIGIYLWKYRKQYDPGSMLLMLAIACIPIVWYMGTANHSYIHYWYTFRSLAVSVFAVGMIPEMMAGRKEQI